MPAATNIVSAAITADLEIRGDSGPQRVLDLPISVRSQGSQLQAVVAMTAVFIGSPEERPSGKVRILVDGALVRGSNAIGSPEELGGIGSPEEKRWEVSIPLLVPASMGQHSVTVEIVATGPSTLVRVTAATRADEHYLVAIAEEVPGR